MEEFKGRATYGNYHAVRLRARFSHIPVENGHRYIEWWQNASQEKTLTHFFGTSRDVNGVYTGINQVSTRNGFPVYVCGMSDGKANMFRRISN